MKVFVADIFVDEEATKFCNVRRVRQREQRKRDLLGAIKRLAQVGTFWHRKFETVESCRQIAQNAEGVSLCATNVCRVDVRKRLK